MAQRLSTEERQRLVTRAGAITIGANVALTIARLIAGLAAGSTAVIADAINSGSDILATLVVLGGARIAARPADEDHPYGHEKAEPVAAKIVGLVVTVTGVVTAIGAINALREIEAEPVGMAAIWVTLLSIVAKEAVARNLIRVGRRADSQAMLADAANQRTDVWSSVAALIGAAGGRFGLPALDPAMGILVAALIFWTGIQLYWRSVNELMDPAPEPEKLAALERAAASVSGVVSVDQLKARVFGAGIFVDCKISVPGTLTVLEGHEIAGQVRRVLREEIGSVRDVLVHVNPAERPRGR